MPMDWMTGAMVGGAAGNLATTAYNVWQGERSRHDQATQTREAREYDERMTREQWARDDNAVQRRVQDLIAAGLSPVLAAGAPAASSAPVHSVNPSVGKPNIIPPGVQPSMFETLRLNEANVKNLNSGTEKADQDRLNSIDITNSTTNLNKALSAKAFAEAAAAMKLGGKLDQETQTILHNYMESIAKGLRTTDTLSTLESNAIGAKNVANSILEYAGYTPEQLAKASVEKNKEIMKRAKDAGRVTEPNRHGVQYVIPLGKTKDGKLKY